VCKSRYAAQQSQITVMPGSIQSLIKAISVSAVLSGTGTRKVLLDSRSTPSNTHCTLTAWPVFYIGQLNLLSSISTALLGLPMFAEQPSSLLQYGLSAKLAPIGDSCERELVL
jgi:hypothetical protein